MDGPCPSEAHAGRPSISSVQSDQRPRSRGALLFGSAGRCAQCTPAPLSDLPNLPLPTRTVRRGCPSYLNLSFCRASHIPRCVLAPSSSWCSSWASGAQAPGWCFSKTCACLAAACCVARAQRASWAKPCRALAATCSFRASSPTSSSSGARETRRGKAQFSSPNGVSIQGNHSHGAGVWPLEVVVR